MKYPTYKAEFTFPESDTVYTTTRTVECKSFLEQELIKEGAEIVSIELVL